MRGTIMGVPIIRTKVFWCLLLGSPYSEKLPYLMYPKLFRSELYTKGPCSKWMVHGPVLRGGKLLC